MGSKARAEIEITASENRLAAGLNAATRRINHWAAARARGIGNAFRSVTSGIGSGLRSAGGISGGVFGGNLLTRGMDAVLEAGQEVRKFESQLVRLQIAAGKSPAEMRALADAMTAVSRDTAISRTEIMAATTNYVDLTGDIDGAATAMRTFARVAQASGASMSDVSGAAAALGDALKISPDDLEATFSGLINQGKAGAVTLKDFAGELASLAPKFARFKGALGREGALQLGAAFQVARKGFGSASEAATGLEAMMGTLAQNATKFEAAGVRVFDVHKDGTKTFRNLHEIVKAIGASKLAKDPTLLTKAFGSKEAEATFMQLHRLAPLYDQIAAAGKDAGVVQRDLTTFLDSSVGRTELAFNRMKESLAEAFTPERIEKFAKAMEAVADTVGTIVSGFEKIAELVDRLPKIFGDHEEAVETRASGIATMEIAKAQVLSPEDKMKRADELLAIVSQKQRKGGPLSFGEEVNLEASRRAGHALKRQAEAELEARSVTAADRNWSAGGSFDATQMQAMGLKMSPQFLELMTRGLRQEIAGAITDAVTTGLQRASSPPQTTNVQIDGNNVATAVKRSTNTRSGR